MSTLDQFQEQLKQEWEEINRAYFYAPMLMFLFPETDTCVRHEHILMFDAWVNDKGNTHKKKFRYEFWRVGERILPKQYRRR